MKLHLLGVNGPFPESNGATSGYLLETDDALFQFDMGSGVLGRLTALTAPESVTALFLSHWHFDHAADLPILMYRLEAMKRVLPVYAPEDPDSALFRVVSAAACFDLKAVRPGDRLHTGEAEITVTAARHPVPAVGFRVACGGKTFGYTGDTNTLPSLAEDYRGCDLLLADGLFPASAWAENKPHLSAELAGRLAEEAGIGRLVITHLNPFFPYEPLLREARSVHRETVIARAGEILEC
jgi:ribonuclease BN (tRNA processing enzyme)